MGASKKARIPLSEAQAKEALQIVRGWSNFLALFRHASTLVSATKRASRRLRASHAPDVVEAAALGEHIAAVLLYRALAVALDAARGRPDLAARIRMLSRDLSIVYAVDSLTRLLGAGTPALRRSMRRHDLRTVVEAATEIREVGAVARPVTVAELRKHLAKPPSPPPARLRGGRLVVASQILHELVEKPSASQIEKIARRHGLGPDGHAAVR